MGMRFAQEYRRVAGTRYRDRIHGASVCAAAALFVCSCTSEVASRAAESSSAEGNPTPEMLMAYAKACETLVGDPIPAFSCSEGHLIPNHRTLDDGTVIELTAEYIGKHPEELDDASRTCDNPALFPKSSCWPNSRLVVKRGPNGSVFTAICRQETLRPEGTTEYDRVEAYFHQPQKGPSRGVAGATCYFKARSRDGERSIEGEGFPSLADPNAFVTRYAWQADVVEEIAECPSCHNSGPYRFSLHIQSVTDEAGQRVLTRPLVTREGYPPYAIVRYPGQHTRYTNTYRLEPVADPDCSDDAPKNSCLGCHELGADLECKDFAKLAFGLPHGANAIGRTDAAQYLSPKARQEFPWHKYLRNDPTVPPGRDYFDTRHRQDFSVYQECCMAADFADDPAHPLTRKCNPKPVRYLSRSYN